MREICDYSPIFYKDILKIYWRSYEGMKEYGSKDLESAEKYLNWLIRNSTFFKIFLREKPVAFIVAHDDWIYLSKKYGEIHELCVLPEFQNKGIGKKLMMMALNHFKRKGLEKSGLWVGDKNLKAINFYRKFGYEIKGKYGIWLRMEKIILN